MKFNLAQFSTSLDFVASYRLLEYLGPLNYVPGSQSVTGLVDVAQTDSPDISFVGPVDFVKTATNRFNALILQPGAWTNTYQETWTYTNSLFSRDARWPTNYFGCVIFYDASNPGVPPPYNAWVLSIDNTNDVNHNGIPDFSDDPASPLPRQPSLVLARGATNFWLTVSGDVGHVHLVQQTLSLAPANWATVWAQSLTNDPQTVWLPMPSGPSAFWRVVAQ